MTERPRDPATGLELSGLITRLNVGAVAGWAVHTRAQLDQRAGREAIILSVGDPDFDTPAPITQSAIAALEAGYTHYTPAGGIMPLREAIAASESRRLGYDIDVAEVIVCSGAQNALYTAMRCIVDTGDDVVLLSPPYTMFDGVVGSCGGNVITVALDKAAGFRVDVKAIAAALTPNTRAILLNSPHNPTGAMAGAEEIEDLAALCIAHGLWLISDEVYADLCYERDYVSPATLPGMRERTIIIRSFSKSHAMTGWRLGWALAPVSVVRGMNDLLNHALYGSPGFIQRAAITALTQDLPEVEAMKQAYRARRDVVADAFGRIPGVSVLTPESGLFCVLDISALGLTGTQLAEKLYAAQKVSILPGEAFGPAHTDWMRLSLCQPDDVLREAAHRMDVFVREELAPRAGTTAA